MSTNSSLPTWIANLGTWVEIDAGRFLKAVGSSGTTGNANAVNTGGTTLTAAQSGLPAHNHHFSDTGSFHTTSTMNAPGTSGICHVTNNTLTAAQYGTGSNYFWDNLVNVTINNNVDNNTVANASQAHDHTPGAPASYGLHVWVRTA